MSLINCKNNLSLPSPTDCVISFATVKATFAITDAKLYVPVAAFLTQDNVKLSQQLKSCFKRTSI